MEHLTHAVCLEKFGASDAETIRAGSSETDFATLFVPFASVLGITKPRASQLKAIAAVRKLGKREVAERLAQ